ncbi:MAG: DENR domain-containing protein, partial [bacterium]
VLDDMGRSSTGDQRHATKPCAMTMEQRLRAFYAAYMPEKVDNIDVLLEKYQGKEAQLFAALVKKYGEEPIVAFENKKMRDGQKGSDDEDTKSGEFACSSVAARRKRRGVGAKKAQKVETRIVIQRIARNRKKAVTIVVGLDTAPNLDLKEAAKLFSKRFAGSSSVKDSTEGVKEVIIQGDHLDECAKMIVNTFNVTANEVFFDVDGALVPFANKREEIS